MRKYLLVLISVSFWWSITHAQAPAAVAGPSAPRLVLVISIDQMRFDYLDRFNPLYKGGLRQIIDKAGIFTNANYRHASTETGPGHSVLLTGSHPNHSGIVANDWWDPFLKRVVNVIDDPVQRTIGGEGRASSPANLLTFTVGDALKAKSPRSHVVGIGLKDRSAILMGGHRADAAYLVRERWWQLHLEHVLHGRRAGVAHRLQPQAQRRSVCGEGMESSHRRCGVVRRSTRARMPLKASATAKTSRSRTRSRACRPRRMYYLELRRSPFADDIVLDFSSRP